ncbi:DUF6531 domain-containing protein [Reyranella sp.]|uniref:DUF6531 domain-containing protein n=1 Tax=Reyranella sp. TaxID=1929291 RepID=UPI00121ED54B|nr:DUF6531 domain-containing protein [Reyranella sp.]TAJ83529.1 MAG: hypothetical protein EPO50_22900 [Reyranella sp.]
MFDYANQGGIGFIQATPTNWASVRPHLTGWSTAELDSMGAYLAANPNGNVLVPQNGTSTVGSWQGSGYFTATIDPLYYATRYLISGGYKGGYGVWTIDIDYGSISEFSYPATNAFQTPPPTGIDPTNLLTGSFLYNKEDLKIGSAEFPFGLSLQRNYDSDNVRINGPMGYGWRHNLMLSARIDSDSYAGFGQYNPVAAVPTIVVFYVMKDINTPCTVNLVNMATAALSASWLMDALVNNAVTVTTNEGTKKFVKIPTLTGGANYAPRQVTVPL